MQKEFTKEEIEKRKSILSEKYDNLKNAAAGIYTLKVSTDSEVAVKRLVVE